LAPNEGPIVRPPPVPGSPALADPGAADAAQAPGRQPATKADVAASLSLALVLAACERPLTSAPAAGRPLAQTAQGSGLALHSVTGLSLPLIGRVGDVAIDQAIVTNIALVENTVGQIVGLQARGVLQLTGGVLGNDVVTQDFSTEATVTSTGTQCNVLSLDLGPSPSTHWSRASTCQRRRSTPRHPARWAACCAS
jgi:hypothetical protein